MSIELFAPVSGPIVPLANVPDPVFAGKLVGDGIAIDPASEVLVAPHDGEILNLHPNHHAVTLGFSGVQILLHIGIDTVQLKGRGFKPLIKAGEKVRKGQELIRFDADLIVEEGKSLLTLMIVTEPHAHRIAPTALKRAEAKRDTVLTLTSSEHKTTSSAARNTLPRVRSTLFKMKLPVGLHARPAALIVGLAKTYSSEVELCHQDRCANAKSVTSLLGLGTSVKDDLYFQAQGADADKACRELAEFLSELEESQSSTQASPALPVGGLSGISVSPGVAIGKVRRLRANKMNLIELSARTPSEEEDHFTQSLALAERELETLMLKVREQTDSSRAAIFAAHLELLNDPDLKRETLLSIASGKTAAFAWNRTIDTHAETLKRSHNEMLAHRANDLRDIGKRVLNHLLGIKTATETISEPTILIAENLTPSETVQMDRRFVKGFCTQEGGATSHVAILARSLQIPALAGVAESILAIADGTEILLDANKGEVRLNPTHAEKDAIRKIQDQAEGEREIAMSRTLERAVTQDGRTIEITANVSGLTEAQQAVELGADGVGLLRSEFLFLERETAPSEDEQYEIYQSIADSLKGRPLTIRTLDVGGDKPLPYLPMPKEENPFLGIRGIRLSLKYPEMFREQLRAILRVRNAKIHIMFPMITTLEDLRTAKNILEEERSRLNSKMPSIGIMVEVPSVALMADEFAREVDFFSIGTNDLTQYTLAMDRGHKELARAIDPMNPAVLRLIEMATTAAHRHNKWVSVCGGIASDVHAVETLIQIGVDELSVSVPSIPIVKSQVRDSRHKTSSHAKQGATYVER